MKKIILTLALVGFVLFSIKNSVRAQMMGVQPSVDQTANESQTIKDEAAGKAVWDKLQSKEVVCKDLKDDDFDVLGDFFMGNMSGSNHTSMNQMMTQRLGENGEKQMHIAIGKRLSSCDTNATLPQGANYFMPMMGFSGMMNNWNNSSKGGASNMMNNWGGNMMAGWGLFGLLTWVALVVFLILGSIFFWKEINRKR